MKACLKALACGLYLLAGVGVWAQEELSRAVKMRQIADLIGNWKLEARILEPPELRSDTIRGTLKVAWTLDDTALKFEATGNAGEKTLKASGILTYNEADFYVKRAFTASFAWSADGRMLPLKGNFKGKTLVLEGQPTGPDAPPLRIKISEKNPRKIEVMGLQGTKEFQITTLTLTR